MARLLDVIALVMLALSIAVLVFGLYTMSHHDDLAAIFYVGVGLVLLRSSVDLLRPRSAG